MHSKKSPKNQNNEKYLEKNSLKLKSPYNIYNTQRNSQESQITKYRIRKKNSNSIGSYARFESVISTRDQSSKRSNTPLTQYLHHRRVNSLCIRVNSPNENDLNIENKKLTLNKLLQRYSHKSYTQKKNSKKTTFNEKNIKKIEKIKETYKQERPRTSFHTQRQGSLRTENKINVENIAKFFQEFHEKSKILLSEFEKTVTKSRIL